MISHHRYYMLYDSDYRDVIDIECVM